MKTVGLHEVSVSRCHTRSKPVRDLENYAGEYHSPSFLISCFCSRNSSVDTFGEHLGLFLNPCFTLSPLHLQQFCSNGAGSQNPCFPKACKHHENKSQQSLLFWLNLRFSLAGSQTFQLLPKDHGCPTLFPSPSPIFPQDVGPASPRVGSVARAPK